MGLLDHLWDDIVAGPRPETGLGKLRKPHSLGSRSNSGKGLEWESTSEEAVRVTRSITIIKPPGYNQSGSTPPSPAGSTPPVSPFSGLSSKEPMTRLRRRSTSDAYEKKREVIKGALSISEI